VKKLLNLGYSIINKSNKFCTFNTRKLKYNRFIEA